MSEQAQFDHVCDRLDRIEQQVRRLVDPEDGIHATLTALRHEVTEANMKRDFAVERLQKQVDDLNRLRDTWFGRLKWFVGVVVTSLVGLLMKAFVFKD